jgi:Holliday junction resolvase RusA-like endonuclease
VIRFFVAGEPNSMSVSATVRWRTADGARQGSYQKRGGTAWATLVGHIGRQHAPPRPPEHGIALALHFWLRRPDSAPKKVTLPLKRPDVDNLIHKLSDQWTGVFWRDDSQIVDLTVTKRFTRDGRVGLEVVISPVLVDEAALRPRPAEQVELAER